MEIVLALIVAHSAPNAVPAQKLAPAIVYAAERHNVEPELLARIIMVESNGNPKAVNATSDDHGLTQINARTAEAYNISPWCLKTWQCNLHYSAKILADMKKMRGFRPCMYNAGPKGRLERFKTVCEKYETKLASL